MQKDTEPQSGTWQEGSARANSEYIRHRITLDPITRLEGHGRIEVFLNETGQVDHAYFQVPELRGFEKFSQGRPVDDGALANGDSAKQGRA